MMDLDKFDKSYAYNIRYNYGKEGSQTNWSPHSCLKIISQPGSVQDVHGCPFKILDPISLKAKLASYGFSTAHTQEVASYAAKGHYQLACGKYFDVMHETKLDEGISHPNQFYDKSQAIIENRVQDGKPIVKTTKSNIANASQKDLLIKKARDSLLDEYDDALWNVTQQAESRLKKIAWDNDDEDFSQVEDMY